MEKEALFPSHELREHSFLFRELMDHMSSLLTLFENGSCEGNEHILVIPPNGEIERYITGLYLQTRGVKQRIIRRLPQSIVRRHLLQGRSLNDMSTLAGDTVNVKLFPFCGNNFSERDNNDEVSFLGTVSLLCAGGFSLQVGIIWKERYCKNEKFSVIFVDKPLINTDAVPVSFSGNSSFGNQHFWRQISIPNTCEGILLLQQYERDEKILRSFIEEIVFDKSKSSNDNVILRKQIDAALLYVETEVGIMLLSYFCIPGYEHLTIAKVLQIITTATDIATSGSSFMEEEKEDILVAFHTIVTGAIGRKLLPHWDNIMERENVAFSHACHTLKKVYGFRHFLPPALQEVNEIQFINEIKLVHLLRSFSLSVLSLMRVMETTLRFLMCEVEKLDCIKDVTADMYISLLVSLFVEAEPTFLPSRIRYITDFSLAVMDVSFAGYAVTTFEAAATQIMEEYRLYVTEGHQQ